MMAEGRGLRMRSRAISHVLSGSTCIVLPSGGGEEDDGLSVFIQMFAAFASRNIQCPYFQHYAVLAEKTPSAPCVSAAFGFKSG